MKDFRYLHSKGLLLTALGLFVVSFFIKDLLFRQRLDLYLLWDMLANVGTAAGVTMAALWLYGRWLWKRWPFYHIMQLPRLGGAYYGQLVSSYTHTEEGKKQPVVKDCLVEIHQRGTELKIVCFFATPTETEASSRSESLSYAVQSRDDHETVIAYTYHNTPLTNKDAYSRLNAHDGTALLHWSAHNPAVLELEYYNRERKSQGRIRLEKISETLKNTFYRP